MYRERSSGGGGGGGGLIPPRWLECPRKAVELVGGKFLAFKTPLDDRYDEQVPIQNRFPTNMLFASMKSYKVRIGLWIDLTKTSRFYARRQVEDQGVHYVKLQCAGHGETPTHDQVAAFVAIVTKFVQQHPLEIIAIHCTHGFNRSGFLICSYLIEAEDWSPEAAAKAFAKARPPGIYKPDYLTELFGRYGDVADAPEVPELPDWCYDAETGVDEDGNDERGAKALGRRDGGSAAAAPAAEAAAAATGSARGNGRFKKTSKFMDGVPGISLVSQQPLLGQVQRKVQQMCKWTKGGFPGCQPVSMTKDNLKCLSQSPYKVSWKADGTRYMMLIDGPGQVYFIDRDNSVFHVDKLTFLHRKNEHKHLTQTLLDGEMVIDEANSQKYPRYLIYDIVKFEGEDVGMTAFGTRLLCIEKEIVGARNMYVQQGKINKTQEPFSVRQKQFWDLAEAEKLLGPKFSKETLGHEPDGLIFQPAGHNDRYHVGRDDTVLKWKPASHNSVDFKLQIVREERPGMLPEPIGHLYVGGLMTPFSKIKVTKGLREFNNKIVECKIENNAWSFMRERTDKSFPNAYTTAAGVLKSICDPVTPGMLLGYIADRRWKKPDAALMPPPNKLQRTQ